MPPYSKLASVGATRSLLEQWGLSTKKSLGQHFLVSDGIVGKIIRLADLDTSDSRLSSNSSLNTVATTAGTPVFEPKRVVLEIGPGIGTLTEALLTTGATVIAVEKDYNLLKVLANYFSEYLRSEKLCLIAADALDDQCIRELSERTPTPQTMVANLPYEAAASIVLEYFQRLPRLQSATVMVQKEVAQRMAAVTGNKHYGAYTIKLRLLAHTGKQFDVAPRNFFPPPRVESTVIRLDRRVSPVSPRLLEATNFLVTAAFFQRRKTIRNSMCAYFAVNDLDPTMVDDLLQTAKISSQVRGEVLEEDSYIKMAQAFLLL
ncbi:MAG: 16S rRNA (adenine(1518)-N(6)/adenine(1519)-N(6))-dimethyltransferase RsmA [Coriobacteriales bacterium]|jgi:16S rRNA (adenine1518-N6/adenine1519-N6)-dimethyltransferase|nr:16S rRNA (adenine(1518)-N(6)/adenine(1519)-N(6))-dimethyltransferase RsmA [Coriobacteriales bacterium]